MGPRPAIADRAEGARLPFGSGGAQGAALTVALDTTFAGVNPTGVGLYSRQLHRHIALLAAPRNLRLQCYGPACGDHAHATLSGLLQELVPYTQGILPLRLLRSRPSIVHSTSHLGPLWGPGKLVVTVHDLIFMRYPADYDLGWLLITRTLLPLVLRRASAVIADSQTTRRDIGHFFKVTPRKIHVVYPGIDEEYRRLMDKKPTIQQEEPYIVCVGPWVRRKNLGVVLRAFSRLIEELPDVRLVITGSMARGMKGPSAEELVGQLPAHVWARVKLAGYLPAGELRALLAGAALLAYPSRFEGFGLPPLEAMAAGVPVVASNTPAVTEVTAGAALLAAPDKPTEWAAAFARILTDPALVATLKEQGLRRSRQFSWEHCARQTIDIYDRIARRTVGEAP